MPTEEKSRSMSQKARLRTHWERCLREKKPARWHSSCLDVRDGYFVWLSVGKRGEEYPAAVYSFSYGTWFVPAKAGRNYVKRVCAEDKVIELIDFTSLIRISTATPEEREALFVGWILNGGEA